jgi:hypothetical protein
MAQKSRYLRGSGCRKHKEVVWEQKLARKMFPQPRYILVAIVVHSKRLPLDHLLEPIMLFSSGNSSDKAPGPDGFTGLFYKKTWEIIKDGILIALNAFGVQRSKKL